MSERYREKVCTVDVDSYPPGRWSSRYIVVDPDLTDLEARQRAAQIVGVPLDQVRENVVLREYGEKAVG